jgi:tetratricopeptide (TPR) repeat protein
MDSAYYYLTKAQNLATEISDATSLLSIYSTFANYYKKQGEYSKAIKYNNKLVDLTTEIGDFETRAKAYSNIANIYNELKDYKKASQYAGKSYKTGEENDFLEIINKSSEELKRAYAGMGDFKKALFYADVFSRTSDSLYKMTQSEAAIFAEVRWQAEKKESQIQFLEKEKSLKDELISVKEAENKSQRSAIYLLIGGLIILVASALLIIWFIRKQRRLEFQEQLNKISQLKLENVRGRISPHFLFNSLSVIQEEIKDKPDVSKRLTAIVNMLRSSLLNIEKQYITLKEELEFVEDFLLLQKNNLNNLQSDIHLADPGLSDYKIPAMIIQIPVENSIKHGLLAKINGEKKLVVDAKIKDDHLNIQIIDNGVGRQAPPAGHKINGTGTGLKVINQTLHLLNSRNQKKIDFSLIDLKDDEGKNCGTEVSISIPKGFNFELN